MHIQKKILHSISNDDIFARTVKLGVSLGNSNSEIAQTIDDIKIVIPAEL
jgi:hypothetical protein